MLKTTIYEVNKTTDDVFGNLKWAVTVKQNKKDDRDINKFAVVQSGWLHRSNGFMVKSVAIDIDDGGYRVMRSSDLIGLSLVKAPEELNVPNFADLYAKFAALTGTVEVTGGDGEWVRVMNSVVMQSNGCWNPFFFNGMCDGFFGKVLYSGADDPVMFVDGFDGVAVSRKGLLMPFRPEK